jgi:hypothetical protein
MSHHLAIDSAAVVATLLAYVVFEGLIKPLSMKHTVLAVGAMLSVASLAFTVLVWPAERRKGPLQIASAGLTGALIVATLAAAFVAGAEETENYAAKAMRADLPGIAGAAVYLTLSVWLIAWMFRSGA